MISCSDCHHARAPPRTAPPRLSSGSWARLPRPPSWTSTTSSGGAWPRGRRRVASTRPSRGQQTCGRWWEHFSVLSTNFFDWTLCVQVWSTELEAIAQRWADQCTFGHDSMRNTLDGTQVRPAQGRTIKYDNNMTIWQYDNMTCRLGRMLTMEPPRPGYQRVRYKLAPLQLPSIGKTYSVQ